MSYFDGAIKRAKASIARKGQSVTWRQLADGAPADSSKPWRPSASTQTDNPVKIVFLPLDRSGLETYRRLAGTEATTGSCYGLMASVDFEPKKSDVVIRNGKQLNILNIKIYEPDGTPILYIIEFDE